MCPAGDNHWSQKAMEQSFLMTNICPQEPALNSGLWNTVEKLCRTWAEQYGDVYFICRNASAKGHKKTDYVNTVDEVERITGIDFFSQLPDNIEQVIESQANIKEWY